MRIGSSKLMQCWWLLKINHMFPFQKKINQISVSYRVIHQASLMGELPTFGGKSFEVHVGSTHWKMARLSQITTNTVWPARTFVPTFLDT